MPDYHLLSVELLVFELGRAAPTAGTPPEECAVGYRGPRTRALNDRCCKTKEGENCKGSVGFGPIGSLVTCTRSSLSGLWAWEPHG